MAIFFFAVLLNDVKLTSKVFINAFNIENFFDKNNFVPLITVTGTIFAYFSIIILSFGDFSRYVKNENELKKVLDHASNVAGVKKIVNLVIDKNSPERKKNQND